MRRQNSCSNPLKSSLNPMFRIMKCWKEYVGEPFLSLALHVGGSAKSVGLLGNTIHSIAKKFQFLVNDTSDMGSSLDMKF
ncbi:hypothetical protein Scep_013084 [Stephania cephalantha]|uniref:Uncharacterized protein n=1 Tax=Stephania cephalantha TaxID=152367 RepID=A0AAP0PAF2_9MAGN